MLDDKLLGKNVAPRNVKILGGREGYACVAFINRMLIVGLTEKVNLHRFELFAWKMEACMTSSRNSKKASLARGL